MSQALSRRSFLAASSALAGTALLPGLVRAQATAPTLRDTTRALAIELDLPAGETAFPVFALRDAARERTGIILVAKGAAASKIA